MVPPTPNFHAAKVTLRDRPLLSGYTTLGKINKPFKVCHFSPSSSATPNYEVKLKMWYYQDFKVHFQNIGKADRLGYGHHALTLSVEV